MAAEVPASLQAQFLRFHRTFTAGGLLISGCLNDDKLTTATEEQWRKRQ